MFSALNDLIIDAHPKDDRQNNATFEPVCHQPDMLQMRQQKYN
jgi:hypothetical protein